MTEKEYKDYFRTHFFKTSSFTSGFALAVIDCAMLMLSICIGFLVVNITNYHWMDFRTFINYWTYLPPIIAVFYIAGLYPGFVLPPAEEVKRISLCISCCFIGISLSIITLKNIEAKWPIAFGLIMAIPIATIMLPISREFARHQFAKCKWYGVPAVIYVSGTSGNAIVERLLKRPDFGYKPALIINSHKNSKTSNFNLPEFDPTEETFKMIKSYGIKVAILCNYDLDTTLINSYYRYTIQIPKYQDTNTISLNIRDFGGILGFSSTHNLTKMFSIFLKRFIDLMLILVSSPMTVPLVGIVALIVKITSPGPVFYGHKRIGKDGREFKCWKFRSMVVDADKMLKKILTENPDMRKEWERDRKFTNDPRVTKIGKFLRKTSIDEIPQFFNVLTGEMSFIGPRPVTQPELAKYGSRADFILSVQPGLSGMWQISGRSDTGYEERITLDSYYIQNWSIWLDIWIIVKTIYTVLRGKGAY